jgi:undecaprenyl-diphosphatase
LMSALQERFRFARALFLALITFWLLCIGYSRVLLGQHYPLDVLAGYVFGSLYALTLLFLMRILMRTLSKSKFWRHRLP